MILLKLQGLRKTLGFKAAFACHQLIVSRQQLQAEFQREDEIHALIDSSDTIVLAHILKIHGASLIKENIALIRSILLQQQLYNSRKFWKGWFF